MKNYVFIPILYLFLTIIMPAELYAYKYGLGSCLDQEYEQSIWSSIQKENLDGFIFLGDNVYGDLSNGKLTKMKKAYAMQKTKLPKWLMNDKEILSIWDDHDFGLNDGGASYKYRAQSQELFNDFWNIPAADTRRSREGIYFSTVKTISDKTVLIVGLDTRYFRSDLVKKDGAYQKNTCLIYLHCMKSITSK